LKAIRFSPAGEREIKSTGSLLQAETPEGTRKGPNTPQPLTEGGSHIKFVQGQFTVRETDGTLSVKLVRDGDLSRSTSCAFFYTEESAHVGIDFKMAFGENMGFQPGKAELIHTISIPARDGIQGARKFTIYLGPPSNGTLLESPHKATVTITD
jgi:hypothetical protein